MAEIEQQKRVDIVAWKALPHAIKKLLSDEVEDRHLTSGEAWDVVRLLTHANAQLTQEELELCVRFFGEQAATHLIGREQFKPTGNIFEDGAIIDHDIRHWFLKLHYQGHLTKKQVAMIVQEMAEEVMTVKDDYPVPTLSASQKCVWERLPAETQKKLYQLIQQKGFDGWDVNFLLNGMKKAFAVMDATTALKVSEVARLRTEDFSEAAIAEPTLPTVQVRVPHRSPAVEEGANKHPAGSIA